MAEPFVTSDPNAWLRPYYAGLAARPGFAKLSLDHQFAALVEVVAKDHPSRIEALLDRNRTTRQALLRLLANMVAVKSTAREVELWRVRKGERELRCVAVYLPTGIDLRLVERGAFRRTALCRDAPGLRPQAAEWRRSLLNVGWEEV